MTQGLGILDFVLGILEFILGILEFLEIASVALLPRNDAENSRFFVMRSPDQVGRWQRKSGLGMTQGLGILEFFLGILDFF